ncbi:hypothetical protein PFFCH_05171 [Plasmodium falciparum FCH/4]|uniref:Uncharacterized protein n=1 Tax=Plasmodium falciparum FCH/4 TaxID=1036724 RepID=A0A024VFD5_PLAFA|nr:hypothetical protein PFFCH_05171 [Plasmodium falciparum FCH/4]
MYIQLNRNKKKKKQFEDDKLNEEETAKIYAEYVRTFEGGNDLDNRHKFVKGNKLNMKSVTILYIYIYVYIYLFLFVKKSN